MAEYLAAHVVHGLLANALHDANLDVLGEKIEGQNRQINQTKPNNSGPSAGFSNLVIHRRNEVVIDGFLENGGRSELKRRDDGYQRKRQHHAPAVRLHVLQKPPHQARVVRLA